MFHNDVPITTVENVMFADGSWKNVIAHSLQDEKQRCIATIIFCFSSSI